MDVLFTEFLREFITYKKFCQCSISEQIHEIWSAANACVADMFQLFRTVAVAVIFMTATPSRNCSMYWDC